VGSGCTFCVRITCNPQYPGLDVADWAVAVAEPQRHRIAIESLTASNIETFVPLSEHMTIVRGRHVRERSPMFGRYLIFSVNELWATVATMRGIASLLMTASNAPAVIQQSVIDALRSHCTNNIYREPKGAMKSLAYGQRVTPRAGPLAKHIGTYDGVTRKREAAIFLLFGQEQRVLFKRGDLLAA